MKVVFLTFYTLVNDEIPEHVYWALENSLSSLRKFNSTIRVVCYCLGPPPERTSQILRRYDVEAIYLEDCLSQFRTHCPDGWQLLAKYAVSTKWLGVAALTKLEPSQALYIDKDTFFFDDVDILFQTYRHADIYARSEPMREEGKIVIDNVFYRGIAEKEQSNAVALFEVGVMLFNNHSWHTIKSCLSDIYSYIWRFSVWMALNPDPQFDSSDIVFLRENKDGLLSIEAANRALKFPWMNRWIRETFAISLTLGKLQNFSMGRLESRDVLQNGEFDIVGSSEANPVMVHYFNSNLEAMRRWIQRYESHG
ncbi:MAG: hypothetical protein M3R31_08395 [Pseudomonadota bacterium]|nr:hypothetical protein [Pseudomonadota bacterium]